MVNNEIVNQADKERQTARKWYRWLWFSPLLTIPTLLILNYAIESLVYDLLCPRDNYLRSCSINLHVISLWSETIAVLGSALWHLVLLIPARNKESAFVRWHGRQELLLAGLITSVLLLFVVRFVEPSLAFALVLIVIPIWLFGTRLGQDQAANGDCSLMRWTGHEAALPGPPEEEEFTQTFSTDHLVNVIRFNKDPEKRQSALVELKRRGLVETL